MDREEITYPQMMKGWYFKTETIPSPRSWDHQDSCAKSKEPVKMIDLSQIPKPTRQHCGNGTYSGAFAFTLTKSPKDSLTVSDMIAAVKKVLNQKSCIVKKYSWFLEYKGKDEAGLPAHPHIHGMYETVTGGRIEAKHFKRAWPVWDEKIKLGAGFRGGYHRPIKSDEAYSEYIAKDGGIGESNGLD